MAEDPATWGNAERVVSKVIRRHATEIQKPPEQQVIGLSLVRQITDALRREGLLHECNCPAGMHYHALNCPVHPGGMKREPAVYD